MRPHTARTVGLLAALLLSAAALAGCGTERADGTPGQDPRPEPTVDPRTRAREVAAAWDGSRAAEQWRAGYHPMAGPAH